MNSLEEVAPGRQGSDGGLSCSPTVQHVTSHGKAPEIEGAQNLFSVFAASATRNPDSNCLGYRPKDAQGKALDFVWISYGEALKQSVDIGSAMAAAGLQQGGRCAVFGQNSPQWMITMQVGTHKGRRPAHAATACLHVYLAHKLRPVSRAATGKAFGVSHCMTPWARTLWSTSWTTLRAPSSLSQLQTLVQPNDVLHSCII